MAKKKAINPIVQLDKDWIDFGVTLYEYRKKHGLVDVTEEEKQFLFDIYRRESH